MHYFCNFHDWRREEIASEMNLKRAVISQHTGRIERWKYLCSVAICHPSECFCVCVGTKNQYLAPRKSNKGGFPQNRGRCGCCRRRRSSSNLKTFFSRIDVFRAGLHNCCCFFGRSCQQTRQTSSASQWIWNMEIIKWAEWEKTTWLRPRGWEIIQCVRKSLVPNLRNRVLLQGKAWDIFLLNKSTIWSQKISMSWLHQKHFSLLTSP